MKSLAVSRDLPKVYSGGSYCEAYVGAMTIGGYPVVYSQRNLGAPLDTA